MTDEQRRMDQTKKLGLARARWEYANQLLQEIRQFGVCLTESELNEVSVQEVRQKVAGFVPSTDAVKRLEGIKERRCSWRR